MTRGTAAMVHALCAVAALAIAGCIARPASVAPERQTAASPAAAIVPAQVAAPADGFEIRLSRSACYGRCPSYQLTIHDDGRVDYVGRSHVFASGVQHGQADPRALAALRSRLQAAEFSPMAQRYRHGTPACGLWATDMPTVVIEVLDGGRWLRAEHDHGCAAAPASLTQLEQAIDAVAQSSQWTSGRTAE